MLLLKSCDECRKAGIGIFEKDDWSLLASCYGGCIEASFGGISALDSMSSINITFSIAWLMLRFFKLAMSVKGNARTGAILGL